MKIFAEKVTDNYIFKAIVKLNGFRQSIDNLMTCYKNASALIQNGSSVITKYEIYVFFVVKNYDTKTRRLSANLNKLHESLKQALRKYSN